jgi:hypothetical protein
MEVNMCFYIEKILVDYGELEVFETPATKELFMAKEGDWLLMEQ